jgi:1-acyl-sn-glycerol-3-phosphate acyltransferase
MTKKFSLISKVLISLWVWSFIGLTLIVLVPVSFIVRILVFPIDKKLSSIRMLYCFFSEVYIRINPLWKIRIEGSDKFNKKKVYVIISNHQSMLDIIAIQNLYRQFVWVSKAENFSYPVLGWIMKISGDIRLERDNPQSFARLVRNCEKKISEGSSIIIFPEGTRSSNGEINRFKEGAFRIAQLAKVSILPIIIDGTWNVLPKKGFIMKISSTMMVRILDEIPFESFQDESPRQLADKCKQIMSYELAGIRQKSVQL